MGRIVEGDVRPVNAQDALLAFALGSDPLKIVTKEHFGGNA
jgi:hypothetical protein